MKHRAAGRAKRYGPMPIPRHRKCERHQLGDAFADCDPYCIVWTGYTTGKIPIIEEAIE